jgi:hypothetical protein
MEQNFVLQNDLIIVFDTMKMLAHFVQIIILKQCYVKQNSDVLCMKLIHKHIHLNKVWKWM